MAVDTRWQKAKAPWSETELQIINDTYGLVPDIQLATRLQRSPNAIKIVSVRKCHISRSMNFYTSRAVAVELGLSCSKQVISWMRNGWLHGYRSSVGAGRHLRWNFQEPDIRRCLLKRPYLCNPKTMPEGHFRSLVMDCWRRNRWYTASEAAEVMGLATEDPVIRYIYRGWIKAAQQSTHAWIIRQSDLLDFVSNDPRLERYKRMVRIS